MTVYLATKQKDKDEFFYIFNKSDYTLSNIFLIMQLPFAVIMFDKERWITSP